MRNSTCLASAMQMVSKLKLSKVRNEQGVRRVKSAGAQLTGEGEACVQALQPCNTRWNSFFGVAITLLEASHGSKSCGV